MPPTAQSRPPTFSAAIQAAARTLLVAPDPNHRELGRALLGCEPLSLYKSKDQRFARRQDLIGHVGAANDADRQMLEEQEEKVAEELSIALGLWPGAMSLKIDPLDPTQWVHASKPVTPLAELRLDRFLNDAIATNPTGVKKEALVDHQAAARIVLRRLRYRTSYDWGNQTETHPSLQVWTTPVGAKWCDLFNQHTPSAIQ